MNPVLLLFEKNLYSFKFILPYSTVPALPKPFSWDCGSVVQTHNNLLLRPKRKNLLGSRKLSQVRPKVIQSCRKLTPKSSSFHPDGCLANMQGKKDIGPGPRRRWQYQWTGHGTNAWDELKTVMLHCHSFREGVKKNNYFFSSLLLLRDQTFFRF